MGTGYSHTCDKCGYSVNTSGPWEFYRDQNGNLQPFGHPIPISEEAKESGIYGLYAHAYCQYCDKIIDVIVMELQHPYKKDWRSFWGCDCELKTDRNAIKCPECGNRKILFDEKYERDVICPRCKEGRMHAKETWIS